MKINTTIEFNTPIEVPPDYDTGQLWTDGKDVYMVSVDGDVFISLKTGDLFERGEEPLMVPFDGIITLSQTVQRGNK